jgi:Ca2+-binding RTX toxin-like protein
MELEPMSDQVDHIKELIKKAADADDSADAMRFSQAALNAANAAIPLKRELRK